MPKELDALAKVFASLNAADQHSVLQFARFLADQHSVPAPDNSVLEKVDIPKPDNESVVKALRRLRATYPMLNADHLMKQTTEQMTAHLVKGQSREQTIENLEKYFEAQYLAQQ